MTLLVNPYLLLGLCLVDMLDAIGFRMGHFGVFLIRDSIRLCGSSRCAFSLFDILSMVPGTINIR